jgi:polyisoprenoid-binding protein YceI
VTILKGLRLPAFLLMFLMVASCASAVRTLYPLQTDPLKTKPGIYSLDPTHTNIIFAVSHLGFSLHHGRFNKITGSLELDTNKPAKSKVFITVQTASIDTNNLKLDAMLRDKGMFETNKFPAATFESTGLNISGDKTATIEGFLTIKGIRNPIQIDATFIGSGTNPLNGLSIVGFSGKASFKRSDYDLKNWLPLIGNDVTLIIEAEFTRTKK